MTPRTKIFRVIRLIFILFFILVGWVVANIFKLTKKEGTISKPDFPERGLNVVEAEGGGEAGSGGGTASK